MFSATQLSFSCNLKSISPSWQCISHVLQGPSRRTCWMKWFHLEHLYSCFLLLINCLFGITSLLFPQSTHFSYILHFLPYNPQLSQNKSQLRGPSVQKTLRMLLRNRDKHTCKFIFSRMLFLQSFLHCPAPESSGQPSEITHRPESPVSFLSWTAFPRHKGAEQNLHLIISTHTGTMNTNLHIFEQRPKSQFPFTHSLVAVKRINCQQRTLHSYPGWSCSLSSVQLSGFRPANDPSELDSKWQNFKEMCHYPDKERISSTDTFHNREAKVLI